MDFHSNEGLYLTGLTDEIKSDPKRFWSFLKSTKGGNRGLPVLVVDGVEISDDREKVNALNKAFAAKFTEGDVTVFPTVPLMICRLSPISNVMRTL